MSSSDDNSVHGALWIQSTVMAGERENGGKYESYSTQERLEVITQNLPNLPTGLPELHFQKRFKRLFTSDILCNKINLLFKPEHSEAN